MAGTAHSMARVIIDMAVLGNTMSDDLLAVFSDEALVKNSAIAVLVQLYADGSHRPTEFLAAAGLTRGGLSKVLDRLEEEGLIERFRDPGDPDGRSVHVRITKKGSRLTEAAIEVMGRHIGPFIESASGLLGAE